MGDDTAVRFALNSLARYASEFGKEDARQQVENGLLAALESHSDTEVKTFLLNQLQLVGSNSMVDPVKKYLTNDQLAEPVVQALLALGGSNAAAAIMEAFPNVGESSKPTMIKALGELRYEPAVSVVTSAASSDNLNLLKTALMALAEIGSPTPTSCCLVQLKRQISSIALPMPQKLFWCTPTASAEKGEPNSVKKH